MKLVVNASPLILLAASESLSILRDLSEEVVVPDDVFDEISAGNERDRTAAKLLKLRWIQIAEAPAVPPEIASWDLGAGETAVLSWAKEHPSFACVLDDRAARNCARANGLQRLGTLGLILAAQEAGLIRAARPILEKMLSAGFYLSEPLLKTSLRKIGE